MWRAKHLCDFFNRNMDKYLNMYVTDTYACGVKGVSFPSELTMYTHTQGSRTELSIYILRKIKVPLES